MGPTPIDGLGYADAPAALLRAQNYSPWGKQLADFVYQSAVCDVLRCAALKLSSNAGENEGDFRSRIAQALRERRDAEIDKLRAQYAPRVATLTEQVRRAQQRVATEQAQLSQQKIQSVISIGSAILGAFMGRKTLSATNISRAGSALRTAGKISKESGDVNSANESLEAQQQRLTALQAELENETARLQGELDPAAATIETTSVKPRKSDTTTTAIGIVWVPV